MEERSKRLSSVLESSVAVEAVKGQRGDRYTRAQMMEGGDECILSREKPGIRNIRLGRGIKGWEYVSSPPIVPSKVVVKRAFRVYKAICWSQREERRREREEKKERKKEYYSLRVNPSKTTHTYM